MASEQPQLSCLADGVEELFILSFPVGVSLEEAFAGLAFVVMMREGGAILAIPVGLISVEALQTFSPSDPHAEFGPHTVLQVPGTREVDGVVMVVDVSQEVLQSLVPWEVSDLDPSSILGFHEDVSYFADASTLLRLTKGWITSATAERAQFYSAEEEGGGMGTAAPKQKAKAKAKAAEKAKPVSAAKASCHSDSADFLDFAEHGGSACRDSGGAETDERGLQDASHASASTGESISRDHAYAEFCEDARGPTKNKAGDFCLSTSKGNGPSVGLNVDCPRTSRRSGERGDLRSIGNGYAGAADFVSVAASGWRSPDRQPESLGWHFFSWVPRKRKATARALSEERSFLLDRHAECFQEDEASKSPSFESGRSCCCRFLDGCGGFANAKDLGIVQYALAFVADSAMRSDWNGVREHLALAMLSIEQAAQDGGRWDLAFNLLLLEDPPPAMWSYKPAALAAQTGRSRAFCPLRPQRMATVSLAYMKEMDYIAGKRQELAKAEEKRKISKRTERPEGRGRRVGDPARDENGLPSPSDAVSMSGWVNALLRSILASKTPFAAFVSKSIHCNIDRSSMPVHTALFPIPLPLDDAWSGIPFGFGSQRRYRVALRRLVRLVVIALNYLHARAPFSVVQTMWRRPSSLHLKAFKRIAALCRAGGPPEMISIFGCGRKSYQLDARFRELQEAVQSLGIGGSLYHSGGAGKAVRIVNDKDQLLPYRELDASRLKIVGTGDWDCRPYLDDLFYMPFVEPVINTFDIKCPRSVSPDFSRCSADETLALCKVWDARSLLRLFHVDEAPREVTKYVKFFNNFKGPLVDRQIGDKRGINYSEGKLAGVSRSLPTGCTLLQIMPKPYMLRS